MNSVQLCACQPWREMRGELPRKIEAVGHTHFPNFPSFYHDRKHMTGTQNYNQKQMLIIAELR